MQVNATRTSTFRRALVALTLVCAAGWLVLGTLVERDAAQCRADHGLLCLTAGGGYVLVGVVAVAAWLTVALVTVFIRRVRKTEVVTVRDGATVKKDQRVYRPGERIIVSAASAQQLRKQGVVE